MIKHINDIKSATTGIAFVYTEQRNPGFEAHDPACSDIIDAPDWTPTGSHRAQPAYGDPTAILIFGERGRTREA